MGRSDTGLTAACSVVSGLYVASTWGDQIRVSLPLARLSQAFTWHQHGEIRYGSHCRLLGCLRPLRGVNMAVKCLQISLFIALAIIAVNGEVREESDAEKTRVDFADQLRNEVAVSEESKEKREALPEAKRNKDKKTKKKGKRKSSGKKNQKKKAKKKGKRKSSGKKNQKKKAKGSKNKRKTNKKNKRKGNRSNGKGKQKKNKNKKNTKKRKNTKRKSKENKRKGKR